METPALEGTPRSVDKVAAPVRLQIAGADLLLSGRFEQWMPILLSEGKEGEMAAMQLLFDVTSNRRSSRPGKDLFAFTTKSVEAVGPQTYQLKGTLRADGTTREVEALLQNPPGHTPFFVILFRLDPAVFPGLWAACEERVAGVAASGQHELRPRAWLREPLLAAA